MTILGFFRPVRDCFEQALGRCSQLLPCLSDPTRRSSWGLKVALVALHVIFVGALFLFDTNLIQQTGKNPWYTVIYLVLFLATLFQYFFTSSSSPGYILDEMRAENDMRGSFQKASTTSKHTASSKNGSLVLPIDVHQISRTTIGGTATSWTKRVMDMYPPGSSTRVWTCTYCNIMQPPRSKHCHDCDKCVLQFDHHCVWLGTCIGQRNHCRFWWYIFEETVLCLWTGILYITYLRMNTLKAWWKDGIMILLLAVLLICLIFLLLLLFFHSYLVLTNQTTYELVRRRRILYLRGIPERVYPFSKGICRNLYNFCCAPNSIYTIEPLPTVEEIEAKARPYTCWDVMSCRCC